MKTVKHEIKLERSVKIILGIFAVGVVLNAFTIGDIISKAEAYHQSAYWSMDDQRRILHVHIDNWPK